MFFGNGARVPELEKLTRDNGDKLSLDCEKLRNRTRTHLLTILHTLLTLRIAFFIDLFPIK
jgi:hypothetical protein